MGRVERLPTAADRGTIHRHFERQTLMAMERAIAAMATFAQAASGDRLSVPGLKISLTDWSANPNSVEEIIARPEVQLWLTESMRVWPQSYKDAFRSASHTLAELLARFRVDDDNVALRVARSALNPEYEALLKTQHRISDAAWRHAVDMALLRRRFALQYPYTRIVTTLLGHDAMYWLTADSVSAQRRLQFHEFTRTGWSHLSSIENQVAIEADLRAVERSVLYAGRIVVALSWTLAALASFAAPSIFFGERLPWSVRLGSTR